MTIRERREAAFWDAWRRGVNDPARVRSALPGFLDALDAIDQAELAECDGQPAQAAEPGELIKIAPKPPSARTATPRRPAARRKAT